MRSLIGLLLLSLVVTACSDNSTTSSEEPQLSSSSAPETTSVLPSGYNTERNAYFGDLHVHTMYSFDAFIFGTTSSPDDAYEFAKGGTLTLQLALT